MMTVQPKYHWQFSERKGHVAQDSLQNLTARFHSTCSWKGYGRIGQAVHLDAKDSRIVFDDVVGKFGTNDFTVAFGIKILNVHGQNQIDLIGNRNIDGHGNWFALFLQNQGQVLAFAVDEDRKGKNFTEAKTKPITSLPNQKWHHIAIVRKGKTLTIYLDGEMVATKTSKTGIARINGSAAVKLGHYTEHTSTAQYEDLRFYDSALNIEEIKALIPPYNPPLQEGEIELVGTDDSSVILTQDVADLFSDFTFFQKLRVGKNTGVTLYQKNYFKGLSQKCYADLPDIKLSRINNVPRSIRIWSSVGEPFTGSWIIKVPNGEYLSRRNATLTTAPHRSSRELFRFHYNLQDGKLQLLTGTHQDSASLKVSKRAPRTHLFVEELEHQKDEFFITNHAHDQWLELSEKGQFQWTDRQEDRALFIRTTKVAEDESQVGELGVGEVALYEHSAYHGKTWILSDSEKDSSGRYPQLIDFEGLNDLISSIRLGPSTGVTLFKNNNFKVRKDREQEVEDILENAPRLGDHQIGNDALSALKIFRTISPDDVFKSYSSKLSQDYRMVGDKLEEFSSYRTILRFEAGAGEIKVSATDLTKIEVEGTLYEIDERKSVTLKPNALNLIMITSEADGIDTPGLKFQTQDMAPNEQVVIFPNQDVHRQIAELEDDALWNATDTQGNLIVDHKAHSQEEVASVQNTIKRMMGTVAYAENEPTVSTRSVTKRARSSVGAAARKVSSAAIEDHPWELNLGKKVTPPNQVIARKSGVAFVQAKSLTSSVATSGIEGKAISQGEFAQLLSQSTSSETAVPPEPSKGFGAGVAKRGLISSIGRGIKKTFKKAKSVVVGAVKGVVHVLVKTAEGVIDFVVDTVKKVVEFVESVIETVVKAVKKFIEFLQFLFNWDDILDTQKYLVQAINDGFDYTAQQIDALKGPVSNFIDDLQETVEGAMNQLVTTLGGDPSEAREGNVQLPEAVEWFLSKLMGGSQKDDAEPTPQLQNQPSEDSKLENFLFHFQEAFLDGAGAVLRGFEGLGETLTTLISNPLKPQLAVVVLVETLRDVIIQLLEAVENLALGFLDAIAEAIEQLKKILNSEIKIPFISDLFRLIGAGKLTLLNLTGLLIAIPATVVSKLIFGETPFKNEPPLNFAAPIDAAPSPQKTRSVVSEDAIAVIEPKVSIQTTDRVALKKSIKHWGNIGLLADVLNGVITAGLDSVPEGPTDQSNERSAGFGFEYVSLILSGFSWLASFPSSPNVPGGRPYNVLAHKVSKSENEQEYWERVMWGWRTAMYWLDVVIMIGKSVDAAKGRKVKLQRFKRASTVSIGASCAFSVIDAGLAITYLTKIPKEDNRGLEIANEVVSWLPNMLAPMRLFGLQFSVALSAVDVVAALSNYGMGHKLLADDLAEL